MSWKDKFPQENRFYETDSGILFNSDNMEVLRGIPDNVIDTIICDPPYGLEFMGKEWDTFNKKYWDKSGTSTVGLDNVPRFSSLTNKDLFNFQKWTKNWAKEALRIAKPGATMLVFGGTRTWHRLACAIEDAGWIIKDTLMWIYGSGFPKATDISKQIDKKFGVERKVIGKGDIKRASKKQPMGQGKEGGNDNRDITAPATPEAKLWDGYKSHGLKPAYEPIIMAMKPNEGSYADNALKWGVAGLNIDAGRIEFENTPNPATNPKYRLKAGYKLPARGQESKGAVKFTSSRNKTNIRGRFPANILLDEEAAKLLDEQSGVLKSGKLLPSHTIKKGQIGSFTPENWEEKEQHPKRNYGGDKGGASRFFYVAKASKSERNRGCEGLEKKVAGGMSGRNDGSFDGKITYNRNHHPTVKPLKLMEYLVKLTSMPNPNQIYLDPFLGSGTTAMAVKKSGKRWIGIEKETEYCEIAKQRISHTQKLLFT